MSIVQKKPLFFESSFKTVKLPPIVIDEKGTLDPNCDHQMYLDAEFTAALNISNHKLKPAHALNPNHPGIIFAKKEIGEKGTFTFCGKNIGKICVGWPENKNLRISQKENAVRIYYANNPNAKPGEMTVDTIWDPGIVSYTPGSDFPPLSNDQMKEICNYLVAACMAGIIMEQKLDQNKFKRFTPPDRDDAKIIISEGLYMLNPPVTPVAPVAPVKF